MGVRRLGYVVFLDWSGWLHDSCNWSGFGLVGSCRHPAPIAGDFFQKKLFDQPAGLPVVYVV
jgi:hypothetical protein